MLEVVLRPCIKMLNKLNTVQEKSCDKRLTLAFKRNHLYEGVEGVKHALSMTITLLPYQAFSSLKPSLLLNK